MISADGNNISAARTVGKSLPERYRKRTNRI
jgi:hypothetical protein